MALELLESGELTDNEIEQLLSGLVTRTELDRCILANHLGQLPESIQEEILLSDAFNWELFQIMRQRAQNQAGPLSRKQAIVALMQKDVTLAPAGDEKSFSPVAIQMSLPF